MGYMIPVGQSTGGCLQAGELESLVALAVLVWRVHVVGLLTIRLHTIKKMDLQINFM